MTNQEPSCDAFQIAIEFPTKDKLELTVLPSTTIGEIRQVVFQSSRANFLTCFNIEFEGHSLVDNVELSSILGSFPKVLRVTAADYTEHEIRIHINRVREVLTGLHSQYCLYGLNQSISFTSAIVGGSLVDEKIATSEVPIIGDIDTLTVKEFIPRNVTKENLQCLKSLSMSNWNPPPLNLKMRGELLYLAVETLEGLSFQISCTVHGFFVNQSTNGKFDARKSTAYSQTFQTLPDLLNSFSEGFKVNFNELQRNLNLRHPFEYLVTSKPSYPWAVDTEDLPNHATSLDSELAAFEVLDTLCARDWNEDIQTARELPKGNAGERVLRDQAIFRCYAEFTDAALKGAMAIINGSVLPINVSTDEKSKIYIHNNIFFSVGYDSKDQFEAYGGDEAAHVAISKDLDGITTVENNEIDGVHTLATVLIDFKGNRIIAQSIVPGILKQNSDASSIIYGSIDGGSEIMRSKIVEALAAEVCKSLHLKKHTVLDSNNVSHDLFTSQDTKWVKGTDSRFYILDLFRLHPIDSLFLENIKEESIENRYPHEMVLLRPELIALFHEHKMSVAMKESGKSYEELHNSNLTSLNPDYLTYAKNADSEDQKEIDKKVANEASEFLLLMISQYFLNIVQYAIAIPVETVSLTNSMHKRGINMRYLGKLAELFDSHKDFKIDAFKILLQEEMVARVSKKMLRILIGNLPLHKTPACIANFLSELFKIRSNITSPLKTRITKEIKSRFRYDIPEKYWNEKTISLLRSICLKVGIQIKAQAYEPAQVPLIEESSILNLVPVLKFYHPSAGLAPDAMVQGRAYISQGKNDLGLDLMQESVSMFEQVFGPINSETGRAYANLAMAYFDINDSALSLRAQIKATIVAERTFGTDSPEALRQYATLGYFMCANENYSAGIRLVQFALKCWKFHLQGKAHPELCALLANLGLLLQKGGNTDESIAILSQNLIATNFIYGPDSIQAAAAHELLMRSYYQQGNYKKALISQRSAFMIYKSLLGETHEQTVNSVNIMKTLTAKAVDALLMISDESTSGSIPTSIYDILGESEQIVNGSVSFDYRKLPGDLVSDLASPPTSSKMFMYKQAHRRYINNLTGKVTSDSAIESQAVASSVDKVSYERVRVRNERRAMAVVNAELKALSDELQIRLQKITEREVRLQELEISVEKQDKILKRKERNLEKHKAFIESKHKQTIEKILRSHQDSVKTSSSELRRTQQSVKEMLTSNRILREKLTYLSAECENKQEVISKLEIKIRSMREQFKRAKTLTDEINPSSNVVLDKSNQILIDSVSCQTDSVHGEWINSVVAISNAILSISLHSQESDRKCLNTILMNFEPLQNFCFSMGERSLKQETLSLMMQLILSKWNSISSKDQYQVAKLVYKRLPSINPKTIGSSAQRDIIYIIFHLLPLSALCQFNISQALLSRLLIYTMDSVDAKKVLSQFGIEILLKLQWRSAENEPVCTLSSSLLLAVSSIGTLFLVEGLRMKTHAAMIEQNLQVSRVSQALDCLSVLAHKLSKECILPATMLSVIKKHVAQDLVTDFAIINFNAAILNSESTSY